MSTKPDYKQGIEESRKIGLGSSDAAMVASVAKAGVLNETAKKRIAVMKGIIEKPDLKTKAMDIGDAVEMAIYKEYAIELPGILSNPYYESSKLSKKYGFKVFNHIDMEFQNDTEIIHFEIKASKQDTASVIAQYEAQFAHHWTLLKEKAAELKKTARLFLVHYPTEDIECHYDADGKLILDNFDLSRVRQVEITYQSVFATIRLLPTGWSIIQKSLPDFKYEKPESIELMSLSDEEQEAANIIVKKIADFNRLKEEIDSFKEHMMKFMTDEKIFSITCDAFKITRSKASTSIVFDDERLQKEHPDIYQKYMKKVVTEEFDKETFEKDNKELMAQYSKEKVTRKSSLSIK